MSYISFTILTDAPLTVRNFLINRGVAKIEAGRLVGVLPGFEWVEVPNPLPVDPLNRRVFLVKLAHEAFRDQDENSRVENDTLADWTKLGKWIKANSVPDVNPTSLKVGANVWLVRDGDAPAFGVWQ